MQRLLRQISAEYVSYFTVGVIVGLITIALRSVFAALLPADTALFYSISVIGAYACGVCLSFVLQRRITFARVKVDHSMSTFMRFAIVALVGAAATWIIAIALRYLAMFDLIFGSFGANAAFCVAAVLASVLTYSLNARIVFRLRDRSV